MKPGFHIGLIGEVAALGVAVVDKRTGWIAKALAGAVLLYLIDPFDLFPDIVPLLGWADDAVVVPAGLWLASRFIPQQVMDDARQRFAKKPPVK
ncbi:MAG TPA: DUF1232 domain-containing protein [Caulobacterales bacterium]|nr:DUF1232 domain-containing protein [Caulobacterales bacterium]